MTSRAIDSLHDPALRQLVVAGLLRYLDTDTIWLVIRLSVLLTGADIRLTNNSFHESQPEQLVALQTTHWTPLLAWVSTTFSCPIKIYDGLLGTKQSTETMAILSAHVNKYDQFKLAAFERAVLASKSYLIGLALVEGFLSTDEAAKAAHVEVQSQIDKWGEVEDSTFSSSFSIAPTFD